MKQIGFAVLFAGVLAAQPVSPALTLKVSIAGAPAGGSAQLQVFATNPQLITDGALAVDLDASVFGTIQNAAVFSATGDAMGYVNVKGQHLDAHFSSVSGSVGQLAELPVFVASVQVLSSAVAGKTATITVDPSGSDWHDAHGDVMAVTAAPATFQVGGSLSIATVTPGGGLLPSGTVVAVNGTGFDAGTTVAIDGVAISAVQFVNAQQINVTLNGAYEMTGRHVHVYSSSGQQADYFSSLPSSPSNAASIVFPLLPLRTYQAVSWYYDVSNTGLYVAAALLNQNLLPVTVTFVLISDGPPVVSSPITIPPGELYLLPLAPYVANLGTLEMAASAPIRMLEYADSPNVLSGTPQSVFPPQIGNGSVSAIQPTASSAPSWTWQIGTPAPPAMQVEITGGFPFTATVSASAAAWLSVSPSQGTEPATLTFTPNVQALAPGTYTGTVTIKSTLPAYLAALPSEDLVIPVSIQVSRLPFLAVSGDPDATATAGSTQPVTSSINVTSTGGAAQFLVSASTNSGGNWLSVTPASGTTPGTITVVSNPTGLAAGSYSGQIVVQGLSNTVTVPVMFYVGASGPAALSANPSSLIFTLEAGSAAVQPQPIDITPATNVTASVQTQNGGSWLSVQEVNSMPNVGASVAINASAVGLGVGTYAGTVTVTSASNGSVQIPVTLDVLAPASPLSVSPATLALTVQAGQTASTSLTVTSPASAQFSVAVVTPGDQDLIGLTFANSTVPSALATPATLTFTVAPAEPGTHYGSIVLTSGSGSITVPVVVTVTASSTVPPLLGSIVSAASGAPGAISPGELITVYGTGIGSSPAGLTFDAAGHVATTLGNTQVLINGTAAPLLYESSGQVNAIVPFEVASHEIASVQVVWNGLQSPVWYAPVAEAAPSIFTAQSNGVGQASVLNQDNSVNSASNAAARGSTIQIFATGGGQTSPASATGTLAAGAAESALPVTVMIDGKQAVVTYHGAAPGEVAGLLQVNAVIPESASTGADAITITVGGQMSQSGVTIAVK